MKTNRGSRTPRVGDKTINDEKMERYRPYQETYVEEK